jgi:hypothetical protein
LPGIAEFAARSGHASMLFYYSVPFYRLPEFMFGVLLAVAWRKGLLRSIGG